MPAIEINEIIRICKARLLQNSSADLINSFSTDTRTIKQGDFFIPLKGKNYDGHQFIPEAISKGANGIFINKDYNSLKFSKALTILQVKDTNKALGELAKLMRSKVEANWIAITGSNGKTTTKELIASLLALKYRVVKNFLNENNYFGVTINILNIKEKVDFAIFEIGTSAPGELKVLLDILRPTSGVLTNIGPSHLENFITLDEVFKEKITLLQYLPSQAKVFLNGDDPFLKKIKNNNDYKIITFGLEQNNDYWADEIKQDLSGIDFRLWGKYPIHVPLLGENNVYNALAAIAVALEFDIELAQVRKKIANFSPPLGRMNIQKYRNITIIDDSYNSNPASLKMALQTLSQLPLSGKKIAVLSDMLELGTATYDQHKYLGYYLAEIGLNYLFAYGDKIRFLIEGAKERGFPENNIFYLDKAAILDVLLRVIDEGDCVLFKASHAMGMKELLKEFLKCLGG